MKPKKPQTLGERMLRGAREALAVAKGERPAVAIWHNGHRYVPERALLEAHQRGRREGMEEAAGIADGRKDQWSNSRDHDVVIQEAARESEAEHIAAAIRAKMEEQL